MRLTTLPPSCAVVMKSKNLNFLEHSGPLQACNGTALPSPCIKFILWLKSKVPEMKMSTDVFPVLHLAAIVFGVTGSLSRKFQTTKRKYSVHLTHTFF